MMSSVSDFLSMGGYAQYVWPAFAVAAVVLVALLVVSRRALRANEAALEALQSDRRRSGETVSAEMAPEAEGDA